MTRRAGNFPWHYRRKIPTTFPEQDVVMIGMSMIEFALFFVLIGNQGSVGVPLGIPPAEEVQLMSDVAPEKCLFYASWATAGPLDPDRNPTERWFAQPNLQAAWTRLKSWALQLGGDEQWEEEYQKQLAALADDLAQQALQRATAVFVEDGERLENLCGGVIVHLEAEAVARMQAQIAALQAALPPEWRPRSFQVEGNDYLAFTPPDSPVEIAVGLRGQFAIIGVGNDAVAKIEKEVRTPEPAWLTELKNRLVVARRASISHIDIGGWYRILGAQDMPDEARATLDVLKLDTLGPFQSVCGLDDAGFVARHSLQFLGEKPEGLASLFDVDPIHDDDLKSMSRDRDWVNAVRLSAGNAFALVEQMALANGETMDQPLREFQEMFGVRLKEDILDQLDGTILIQGNLNSANPYADWLIQLGIDDEMSFYDNLQTFHDRLRTLLETDGGGASLVAEEIEGFEAHRIEIQGDMMAMFLPKPAWFLRDGKLCIVLEKETIAKWVHSPGESLLEDPHVQRLMNDAKQSNLTNPIAISRIDMANVIRLAMSFSSMLEMAGSPLAAGDLPSTEVLVNGMEPCVSAVFRSERGFEFFTRQTHPSSAPGATLATAGILSTRSLLRVRAAAQQMESMNNVRQILLALLNYESAYGTFPARFNQDAEKKPLLSWRVHILPFIDHQALYDEFHLDEPWDSEHNLTLVERMPRMFQHPKLKLPAGHTVYLAPQGADTGWTAPKDDSKTPQGLRLAEMIDGTSNTAMVIEAEASAAVVWTKPDDFSIDGEGLAERIKPVWSRGILLGNADGSVFLYKPTLSADQWRAIFGCKDGQVVDPSEVMSGR